MGFLSGLGLLGWIVVRLWGLLLWVLWAVSVVSAVCSFCPSVMQLACTLSYSQFLFVVQLQSLKLGWDLMSYLRPRYAG
ncbi:hypothetical protein CC80DRAFT_47039 [Byssothecium circinans]|uniref:Uncharacterized protein n=1 Tax=Byssothecium circinans TaxID=147558 RepID=A0A6A5U121_9PLEO|nr:hypothetical protein CC80DRAFT_47039 [Byssothecium circinans]